MRTTKPAANNFLQQQEKFDRFIECYNQERPHQAIEMQYPGELYQPSPRPYHGLDALEYPFPQEARAPGRVEGWRVGSTQDCDG